ncbi:MAG: ABC transporter permease subunit [Bacillota bacterium]
MKAFWLELKSVCRNFRFLALIFLLLCLLVMIYAQFKLEQVTEYESTLRSLNREVQGRKEWVEYWERRQRYYYTHGEPLDNYDIYTVESSLESSIGTYEEALNRRNAYKDKNWREYNLAMSEKTFSPYYSYLAEKNLPPIGPWDTTPWGFLFNSLRKLLPKVLGLIVLLISVNRLHQDRKFGTIKTNLSQPKMRLTYLARKTALSFVASCLIVFIPLMLMFGILGVGQGYVGACLPVLYAKDNIWRLSYSDEEIFEIQDYPHDNSCGPQPTDANLAGRLYAPNGVHSHVEIPPPGCCSNITVYLVLQCAGSAHFRHH